MGAAILDLEQPSKVKFRSENFVLAPEEWYEERGFVANVVFPCAALCDAASGKIAVYYGAADSYVGLAYATVEEIVDYVKSTSEEVGDDSGIGRT
jgi:beta-1,4-mannooligosaccharide/beta-1,4-mannosyl-N-acetylglucosamine phosphorylase